MPGASDAPDADPRPARTPRARVVLLHRPGAVVPADLREALSRNHSEPIEVDHPLAAMARLSGAKAAVLLLCEPENLVGVRELLAAVERYNPRVTRWEYIPGENPPLRPVAGPDRLAARPLARPEPEGPAASARDGSNGGPQGAAARSADPFALRLTKETGSGPKARSSSVGDLLTRDEMEALFSEDSP